MSSAILGVADWTPLPCRCMLAYFLSYRAMTHDETVYPNADKFQPERYFSSDGKLNNDTVSAFGFGRR
jgi:cytochrome P450